MQDATMQNRMDAGFRKYCPCDTTLINYATYKVHFTVQNDKLCLEQNNIWQMWNIDKYIELLMGEIPRLTDNINGYGPQGKDFIAHVDIPQEVHSAYQYLYQHLNIKHARQIHFMLQNKESVYLLYFIFTAKYNLVDTFFKLKSLLKHQLIHHFLHEFALQNARNTHLILDSFHNYE